MKPALGTVCEQLIDDHTDGAYALLRFNAVCADSPTTLSVACRLLFDMNPQLKGLLKLQNRGATSTAIFSPDTPTQNFALEEPDTLNQFVGFNMGVELGQLVIVALFLPLAFAMRESWFYRKVVLMGGSALIALIAAIWFAERAFNLKLITP